MGPRPRLERNHRRYHDLAMLNHLHGFDLPVCNAGGSREVRNVIHAVWDAYDVARGI